MSGTPIEGSPVPWPSLSQSNFARGSQSLKSVAWHTYSALRHDLWLKSINLIPSTGNKLIVRVPTRLLHPKTAPILNPNPKTAPVLNPINSPYHFPRESKIKSSKKQNTSNQYLYIHIYTYIRHLPTRALSGGPAAWECQCEAGATPDFFGLNMRGSSHLLRETWVYNGYFLLWFFLELWKCRDLG